MNSEVYQTPADVPSRETSAGLKINIFAIGSTGDVRPAILLGQELQRRGHKVSVTAFANFEKMVTDSGLGFHPMSGSAFDMMNNIMGPDSNGLDYLPRFEKAMSEAFPEMLRDLCDACQDADALICNYFAAVPYSVAEKFNIPCIQFYLCPMDPNGVTPISSAPGQNLGKLWCKLSYRLGYLLIGLLQKRYMTGWCRDNGVTPRKIRPWPDYRIGDHTVTALTVLSPLLMPRPKEWPDNVHMTGFWFDENETGAEFEPDPLLAAFLSEGSRPVYIGFGSMVSGDMSETMRIVCDAVRKADVRAVISGGWGVESGRMENTEHCCFVDYVPHAWLFDQVSAVVHHGGAGTTSAGLYHGKPGLVIPFGGDQYFYGKQMFKNGFGPKPIRREKLTVDNLAAALKDLTENRNYAENARQAGEILHQEHGLRTAANLVEKAISEW